MFFFRIFGVWALLFLSFVCFAFASASSEISKRKVDKLGGKLFFEKGKVIEVVLNKSQVEDKDLALILQNVF